MYLHLFLLLLSSGASSHFLPLKETRHLQNETKYSIIHEMLCLLKAEKGSINGEFHKPLHIKNESCAHDTTEIFISGLKNITTSKCIQTVETNMETLENKCSILKNSSSKDQRCSKTAKTSFLRFKESLEEFLRWVNEKQDCGNIRRSESGLYPDGICSCPDPWKAHGGLF